MTDVFEEVDSSLRQDAATKAWKKLLPWLIAGFISLLIIVGGWEFYRYQRNSQIEADAKVFDTAVTALQKNDLPAARQAFVQLGEGKGGYAALASHMAAQVEGKMANDPAAIELALKNAIEKDKEGLLGSLATLKLAYAKADKATLPELEQIVKPLIAKGGYAGALARELVAAKVLDGGDIDRARTEYQALSLQIEAPQAMKQRAEQALLTLPPSGKPAAAAPAAAPATPVPAAPAQPPSQ